VKLSVHSSSTFCIPRTKAVSALRSACSHFTTTKYLPLSKNTVFGAARHCCVISKAVPDTCASYKSAAGSVNRMTALLFPYEPSRSDCRRFFDILSLALMTSSEPS
jgi:hypothetical protein